MASDYSQLIKHLQRLGCEITWTRKHIHVRTPEGKMVVLPSTSSDYRGIRNSKAQLRRAGLEIPR